MTLSPENDPIPADNWHWPVVPADDMTVVVVLRKTGLGTPPAAANPTSVRIELRSSFKILIKLRFIYHQ
jgi:hypothetical protein